MKQNFVNKQLSPAWGELEAQAFDNYDPETASSYDPDNFAAPQRRVSAYFDLLLRNTSAEVPVTIELFNALKSFTERQNLSLKLPSFDMIPASSVDAPANKSGIVGFTAAGDLVVFSNATAPAVGQPVVYASCNQFPYKGLLHNSIGVPFQIDSIRMTTATDGQIDNTITHVKNSFLGASSQNEVNPRTFFQPNQFQARIIDIPLDGMNFIIDGEHGLLYTINPGEQVKWNLKISRYVKNTVR